MGATRRKHQREEKLTRRQAGEAGRQGGEGANASLIYVLRGPKNPLKHSTSTIRALEHLDDLDDFPDDLSKYLALCEGGQLYEHLLEPGEDRRQFKRRLFTFFFGKPYYRSSLRDRFEAEFPTIAWMLKSLKRHDHAQPARLMQSYESTIFIAIVCQRIMNERPRLPIYTIHDSVLTTPDHIEYAQDVIRAEFAKLGIAPTLRLEQYDIWETSNVE